MINSNQLIKPKSTVLQLDNDVIQNLATLKTAMMHNIVHMELHLIQPSGQLTERRFTDTERHYLNVKKNFNTLNPLLPLNPMPPRSGGQIEKLLVTGT